MTNKALRSKVLHLALPAALKNLLDMIQILIDLVMVGSLGAAALAAVGLSMQYLMVIQVIMTLYLIGSSALIARYIGSGRKKRSSSVMFSSMFIAIGLSLAVGFFGWFQGSIWFIWMGSESDVVTLGSEYLGILSLGMGLIFLDALAYNALSAAGDTKSSLYVKIVSAGLNAFLNYLFIFGHGGFDPMGVSGAAIATLCAYGFNLFAYAWLFKKSGGALEYIPIFFLADLKRVLKIGLPSAYERGIGTGSYLLFVMIIGAYGTHVMAGYQIGLRIEAIAFMPGFGFSVAAMALVGQNLGAKRYEEAYDSGIMSAKIAAWFMGCVGIILVLFPEYLAEWFTNDVIAIEQASLYLRLVGISQVPLAFMFVFSGALRGAAATKITLRINTLSLWMFRILPSFLVLSMGWEIIWVYVAMCVETFIKGFWYWHVYHQKEWLKTAI